LNYTKRKPLVISSSGLIAYGRCPKSFELSYVEGYRMKPRDCMSQGSAFHFLMQRLYEGATEDELETIGRGGEWAEMYDVFLAYRAHKGNEFPARDKVIRLEEPIFSQLLPNVWLRTTYDRLWDDNGELTDDDYKTFDKAMQLDVSMDTQGLLFLAVLQRKYGTQYRGYKRRYLNVRRQTPLTPKNATQQKLADAGKPFESWSLDECYKSQPLRLVPGQADVVWKEMQSRAEKILWSLKRRTKDPTSEPFDRVYLKGSSPYTCGGQICRTLCMKQFLQGGLTEIDLITEGVTIDPPPSLTKGFLKK